jgi:translation initiation factor IF-1
MREPSPTILSRATVMEVIKPNVYRVQLSNGHRLTAYLAGRLRMQFVDVQPGTVVELEMSPYDLSEARILGFEKKESLQN